GTQERWLPLLIVDERATREADARSGGFQEEILSDQRPCPPLCLRKETKKSARKGPTAPEEVNTDERAGREKWEGGYRGANGRGREALRSRVEGSALQPEVHRSQEGSRHERGSRRSRQGAQR
ncbi:unnamed protein product, partial [Ectocarpus sp. 12 AP-2014]